MACGNGAVDHGQAEGELRRLVRDQGCWMLEAGAIAAAEDVDADGRFVAAHVVGFAEDAGEDAADVAGR